MNNVRSNFTSSLCNEKNKFITNIIKAATNSEYENTTSFNKMFLPTILNPITISIIANAKSGV